MKRLAFGLTVSAVVLSLSSLVLLLISRSAQRSLVELQVAMRPDMTLALTVVGLALIAGTTPRGLKTARVLELGSVAVICLMVLNWVTGPTDIGLGALLGLGGYFVAPGAPAGAVPFGAILGYALLVGAVILARQSVVRARLASQALASAVAIYGYFSVLAFIVGPVEPVGVAPLIDLPLMTGLAWIALAGATLLRTPDLGITALMTRRDLASRVTWLLVGFAVLGSPALDTFRDWLEQTGVVGPATGVAVDATFSTVALWLAALLAGNLIHRFEGAAVIAQAERDRYQEVASQAQKMEAIGLLAGGVAHDFNNLLTAITGYSDMIAAGSPPGSEQFHDASEIHAAALRGVSLTRQLLAFSGRQALRPSVIDLHEVVIDILPMLRRLLGEDVDVATQSVPDTLVLADRGQLEQIVVNLAVNARAAMPSGGRVLFEVSRVEMVASRSSADMPDEAPIVAHPGWFARLAVADTGTGIPADILPHIFEPFFTTRRDLGGTGLGLSTVDGIVRALGGWVSVDTEVGHGTTFAICLPLAQAAIAAASAEEPEGGGDGSGRILLVEDDAAIRTLATRVLRRAGYAVTACSSGEEALEHLADSGVLDLLVTDVVMGGMTGVELSDRLLAIQPHARVVFMSGYPQDRLGPAGTVTQEVAFLQKPFVPGALLRAVAEAMAEQTSGETG